MKNTGKVPGRSLLTVMAFATAFAFGFGFQADRALAAGGCCIDPSDCYCSNGECPGDCVRNFCAGECEDKGVGTYCHTCDN